MKKHLLTIGFVLSFIILFGQKNLFVREYDINSTPAFNNKGHVIKTLEGGYLLSAVKTDTTTGYTQCILVMKMSFSGLVEWSSLLNDSGSIFLGSYATQLPDSGYMICNSISENADTSVHSDCLVIRIDKKGNFLWSKRYGIKGRNEFSRCIFQSGSRTVLAGCSSDSLNISRTFLCFLDASGNILGDVNYKLNDFKMDYAAPAFNGDILLSGGYADSNFFSHPYFLRVDSNGTVLWARILPTVVVYDAQYISNASNGDLLFTGRMEGQGGLWDIIAMRVTATGNLKFCKAIGGSSYDEGMSIHENRDGSILIIAEPESFLPGSQTSSILLDSLGNLISMRGYETFKSYPFGGVYNPEDSTYTIFAVKSGYEDFAAPVFMLKCDESGRFPCHDTVYTPAVSVVLGFQAINPVKSGGITSADTTVSYVKKKPSLVYSCGDYPLVAGTFEKDALIVPNVFSPNGDGYNDVFFIQSQGLEELHYDIYNRWGIRLYEANRLKQGWDGRTTSGQECPEGVYYYVWEGTAKDQQALSGHGFLHLIR